MLILPPEPDAVVAVIEAPVSNLMAFDCKIFKLPALPVPRLFTETVAPESMFKNPVLILILPPTPVELLSVLANIPLLSLKV
ncbi:MAG TPA: hypothetical protein V6D12_12585 [Candidatus Obscuribacterales bacterium]